MANLNHWIVFVTRSFSLFFSTISCRHISNAKENWFVWWLDWVGWRRPISTTSLKMTNKKRRSTPRKWLKHFGKRTRRGKWFDSWIMALCVPPKLKVGQMSNPFVCCLCLRVVVVYCRFGRSDLALEFGHCSTEFKKDKYFFLRIDIAATYFLKCLQEKLRRQLCTGCVSDYWNDFRGYPRTRRPKWIWITSIKSESCSPWSHACVYVCECKNFLTFTTTPQDVKTYFAGRG